MGIEHSLTDQQGDCMDLTITICDMVRDVYVYILYIIYIYIIYIIYLCVCMCCVYACFLGEPAGWVVYD